MALVSAARGSVLQPSRQQATCQAPVTTSWY